MAILPRQFKALMEMLRAELAALREVVQKGAAAVSNQYIAQNESKQDEREKISRAIDDLTNQKNQADDAAETSQQRRHGQNLVVQRVLALGTLLAFIAASIYAWEAHRQLCTMQETYREIKDQTTALQDGNSISRAAAIISQRAYVNTFLTPVNFVRGVNPEDKSPGWFYQMGVENGGNTPAFNLVTHVNDNYPTFAKLPRNYDFRDLTPTKEDIRALTLSGSPGTPTPMVLNPHSAMGSGGVAIPEQALLNLNSGRNKSIIFIWGSDTYRDVFGCFRKSEFCVRLTDFSPDNGGKVVGAACPSHNCADQDCPDFEPTKTEVCEMEVKPFPEAKD